MHSFPIEKKNTYNILKRNSQNASTKMKLYQPKEIRHLCFHSESIFTPIEKKKQNNFSKNERTFYESPKNSDDNLSLATTNLCDNKRENKVKKVTFSTVEIIRVVKYKKYNLAASFPKSLIKKNQENLREMKQYNDTMCLIF